MRFPVRRLVLLFSFVTFAACDESVSGPDSTALRGPQANLTQNGAEREIHTAVYDMSGTTLTITCEDGTESETVLVHGQIFERLTGMYTPSGVSHYSIHTMPVGLGGVGTVSGAKYRIKDQMHGVGHQTPMSEGRSFHSTFRLESRETGQRFRFSYRGTFIMNANGETTVERERATAVCEL